jgi:hypothetical protein
VGRVERGGTEEADDGGVLDGGGRLLLLLLVAKSGGVRMGRRSRKPEREGGSAAHLPRRGREGRTGRRRRRVGVKAGEGLLLLRRRGDDDLSCRLLLLLRLFRLLPRPREAKELFPKSSSTSLFSSTLRRHRHRVKRVPKARWDFPAHVLIERGGGEER